MWLKLNRPQRLNAMTIESWGELNEHLAAIDADRDVRCLVLAGEGRAFPRGTRRGRDPRAQRGHHIRQAHPGPAPGVAEEPPEQHAPHPPDALPGDRLCARLRGRRRMRGGVRVRPRRRRGVGPIRLSGGEHRGDHHQRRHVLHAAQDRARQGARAGLHRRAHRRGGGPPHRAGQPHRAGRRRAGGRRRPRRTHREPGPGRGPAPQGDDRRGARRIARRRAPLRDRGARADRDDPRQPRRDPRVLREA